MDIQVGGVFGLIVLILDVVAIVKTFESSAPTSTKVIWIVIILLLPVLGVVLWWLFGPKGA